MIVHLTLRARAYLEHRAIFVEPADQCACGVHVGPGCQVVNRWDVDEDPNAIERVTCPGCRP